MQIEPFERPIHHRKVMSDCIPVAFCQRRSDISYWTVDGRWREEKIMIQPGFAVAFATVLLTAQATADEATPPGNAGGRYVFSKQADGFLRLDTQSGAVALCSQQPVGWACKAAPEDRTVLENEIARLQSENAALKQELLSHGLALPSGAAAEPSGAQNSESSVRLPSDADIDRVIAFFDRVWQRFVEAVERAQKQVFNKS
jgi:hypothetical protein